MFYSHTFLARKGPLGTVWCAAHLQHKLKKSHYITTDVRATVDRIMFPEVPIALRMSGHLLLGVVRIYSKQVDYLYEDCNEIRITINRVFTTVSVNLPNDATHAPVHSITLPENFDLDAMELDDYYKDWGEDPHLKDHVDITLTEQIPTGKDPYIVISFNEHDLRISSSSADDNLGSGPVPMEEDAPRGMEADFPGDDYPSPRNRKGPDDKNAGNNSPKDPPSIEIMREAQHDFDIKNSPILPDRADPDTFLVEQINKDHEMGTPVMREVTSPDGPRSSSHNHEEHRSFGHLDSPIPFADRSPEMEIRPSPALVHRTPQIEIRQSPPVAVQPIPPVAQPRVRRNRKRQLYDEATVLSNKSMKNALDDTSDIRRAKRNCPLSALAIWKQNNRKRLRKEGLFDEPFITGSSADLWGIYKEDCAKCHLISTEEVHEETNVAQPQLVSTEATHGETNVAQANLTSTEVMDEEINVAQSPGPRHDGDVYIEILRNNDCASPDRFMPGPSTFIPSPNRRSCSTPENSNSDLQSGNMEVTGGNKTFTAADMGASGNLDSEIRTPEPDAFYDKGMQADDRYLFDIPELVASPGELGFLEQDDSSPARFQGTPEFGLSKNQQTPEMSSRTRAVARYLEKQSVTPARGNSGGPPEELSLNKILQGKTRKISARMFYETLVLKSHELVDAHQEHPYGDISLKVTPKLSKGKFSI